MNRDAVLPLFLTVIALETGACASPPLLNSDLRPQELRQRLDAQFTPGMTVEQVQTGLDEDGVPRRLRRVYAGPPEQLLARLFSRGGFWVDEPEFQDVRYVDAWFVFGADGRLVRVETEPRRMRVEAHQYIDPPFHTPEILPREPRRVGSGGAHAEQ